MIRLLTIAVFIFGITVSVHAQKHERIFGNSRNGRNWMQNSFVPSNLNTGKSATDISINEVNSDYADRMWAVRNDQHLSPWKRDLILRRLNAELQQKIWLIVNANPPHNSSHSSRISLGN